MLFDDDDDDAAAAADDDDDDITRIIVDVVIKFNLIACQLTVCNRQKLKMHLKKPEEIICTIQY